jgi:signal transduction histidine kinase
MKRTRDPSAPFALTRLYALVSLIGVVVSAVALALLYRGLSIPVISEFGEQSNIAVARTVLNGVYPELVDSLQHQASAAASPGVESVPPRLPPLIRDLIRDTPVERIKVFNAEGGVVYSSRVYEIGSNEGANPLVRKALRDEVGSRLSYRDTFSLFDRGTEDDNLIETYVPVVDEDSDSAIGVFEIYTSIDTVATAMARNELVIVLGVATIMAVLYGSLLYVVRRSEAIIARQRETIVERNHTLEVLATRLLATEDSERRRIATELHEEIAQTLCAAKVWAEAGVQDNAKAPDNRTADPTRDVLSLVVQAIGDVRALATDLRPSSLDDFGLLAATRELSRRAEGRDPDLQIGTEFSVREDEVPVRLKGVIFRIIQETIKRIASDASVHSLRIALGTRGDRLELSADLNGGPEPQAEGSAGISSYDPSIASAWERAILSGATLDATRTATGTIRFRASWTHP